METLAAHPAQWAKLVSDWRTPHPGDAAWLMYSANYLCRCGEIRWALDPLSLPYRLMQESLPDLAVDLAGLNFVLLTHRHGDHFDPQVLRSMQRISARWVVPPALAPAVLAEGVPAERIIPAHPLQPVDIEGFQITPFESLHWEAVPPEMHPRYPDGRRGLPETGYLVEAGEKRWLFPGDIRNFDPSQLPIFGPVDVLFAHIWLGRAAANSPVPPLVDEFCRFYLALQPQRIVLTHLEEWGRPARDFWDVQHARLIIDSFHERAPDLPVEVARLGDRVDL